jgi:hypothetical protein
MHKIDICMVLAWLGVFMSFFHLLSPCHVSKPVLEGRFRYLHHPTNSQTPMLLYVSMVGLHFVKQGFS